MIRLSPVRLIDENNEQVGVVETPEALARAREAGLDLVEIQPDARPPLCKIMDYGKYKYEQSKKDQKNRASQKSHEMKEVRLGRSIKVDPHDVQIRIDRARKFLLQGHKVMLVQQFRGREVVHADLGEDILRDVVEALEDISKVDTPPRKMGRRMSMIISPDKPKVEAYKRKQEKAKQDEEAAKEAASEAEEAEKAEKAEKAEAAEANTSTSD